VACPDLSGLSSNFDAAIDAGDETVADDASNDVTTIDASDAATVECGAARRVQALHFNNNAGDASTNSVSLLLALAQSAGDFIIATVNYDDSKCGTPAVTDSRGNTYVKLVPADGLTGAGDLETWGAQNVAAADLGQNTVTVTFSNACTARAMKVVHYTGIATSAAVESTSTEHGTGTTAPSNTLAVTTPALVFAHTADQGAAYEAGPGWSLVMIDDWATLAEERDALDAGTYIVDYSHSSENWVIQGVALRRCTP
jgi:hypothetical protein